MSVTEQLREISERVAALEASISYLNDNIHQLRTEIRNSKKNPAYLRVLSLLTSGIFAWLAALTYFLARISLSG